MPLSPERLAQLLQSIAAFNTALKTQLGLKLGKTETAADSSKLEGKTFAEVSAAIQALSHTEVQAVSDALNAFIARRDNPNAVTKAQVGLGNVDNFATATVAEAKAATAVDKLLTPAGLAAFWADKVGAAPSTLDTIAEIAAALNNNPDVVNQLLTSTGANAAAITALQTGKLDKTAQAADSAKLEGKTLAEVISQAQAGVDMSQVVKKTDDFGQYKVGTATLTDIIAGLNAGDASNLALVQAAQAELDAFIAKKATSEEAIAGTDDEKYITALALKAKVDDAINKVVDGAPEALDTLKELADRLKDQDDAVAALVATIATKLGKTETAADSTLFAGKTPAQYATERDTAITAAVDPLDARLDALEGQVGGGSGFLTETSDLGANPVALTSDTGAAKTLKAILDEQLAAVEAAQTAADAADAKGAQGITDAAAALAAAQAADGKAVAAQTELDSVSTAVETAQAAAEAAGTKGQQGIDDAAAALAAANAADGKAGTAQTQADKGVADAATAQAKADAALPATGTAADSSKLNGQSLDQILATIRGGDVQTIQAVQDALDAYIAQAEAGGLVKATSAEAIAGTDDAHYITALALKAKVDDAISKLVDGAPTALDTLKELADKLTQEGDALAALLTTVDGKLGKTEQAADSAKLGGKTQSDITATSAEVTTGTENGKFVTPAALKPSLDALALAQTSGDAALQSLVDSLTAAFNDAADDIDETPAA